MIWICMQLIVSIVTLFFALFFCLCGFFYFSEFKWKWQQKVTVLEDKIGNVFKSGFTNNSTEPNMTQIWT